MHLVSAKEIEETTGPGLEARDAPLFVVQTEVFDGPLDLLLHLVKRDGISLARVSISAIADSYLSYLDRMRALDLAIAADWLVMAATLCHLKALELLPKPPAILEPSEPDPRDALLEKLRDYEQLKLLSEAIDALPLVGRDVFVRTSEPIPKTSRPFRSPVDSFGLLDVLHEVIARSKEPEPTVKLGHSGPNIAQLTRSLLQRLGGKGGTIDLVPLLAELPTRGERVISFIAALEMARLGWVDVEQEHHKGPVRVTQLADNDTIDVGRIMGESFGASELPAAQARRRRKLAEVS